MDNVLVKSELNQHDFITGGHKVPELPVLTGFRGRQVLEAGYIYAPYIPLQLEATVYDPNDFQPTSDIMTRYAKKVVDNRFYGHISIDNLTEYPTVTNVEDFDNLGND